MAAFFTTALFSFGVYLCLTAGSGPLLGLWSAGELKLGVVTALVAAAVSFRYFAADVSPRLLNPLRWLQMLKYVCGGFFIELAKANWDVAMRVITGRIRPGIVRVESGMDSDAGMVMLANSITLTPGTLTVDVEEDTRTLFVHMIDVPEGMESRYAITADELFGLYDCAEAVRRLTQ